MLASVEPIPPDQHYNPLEAVGISSHVGTGCVGQEECQAWPWLRSWVTQVLPGGWSLSSAKQQPELQLQLFTPDGVKKAQHHQGAF